MASECFSVWPACVPEQEEKAAVAREKARLQEMDEEEYDALTEEQKIHFDNELLQALRERKKRCVNCSWTAAWECSFPALPSTGDT